LAWRIDIFSLAAGKNLLCSIKFVSEYKGIDLEGFVRKARTSSPEIFISPSVLQAKEKQANPEKNSIVFYWDRDKQRLVSKGPSMFKKWFSVSYSSSGSP
jgi:hypothetical protein